MASHTPEPKAFAQSSSRLVFQDGGSLTWALDQATQVAGLQHGEQ
jgi:hypothetical protein